MLLKRRTALLSTGAMAGLLAAGRSARAANFTGRSVVYASWGGQYADAQKLAYCDPFEKKTGARVVIDGPVDPARVRVMLEGKNYSWQVICADTSLMLNLAQAGLLTKVDTSLVNMQSIPSMYRYDYGVMTEVGAYVVGYSTKAFDGKKTPTHWADLFDIKTFPGKRSLSKIPKGTLELALLADGVPKDKLYPLDIERALRKLDTIKDNTVFFQTNAQSQQLLADGVVSCGFIYSSRAFGAKKAGAPVAISWPENLITTTPVFVPKGVTELDIAWGLVNEMLTPENQALMSKLFVSSPTNPDAMKLIDPEIQAWLPTNENNQKQGVLLDEHYWGANLDTILARWQAWMLT